MSATAETAMGGGFRRNTVSELKLKNRRTGSTLTTVKHFHHVISCVTEWKMESVWVSSSYVQIVPPF